jgi:hypothetical protein
MPKVSVVIPTCNRPELLKRAIRSVLAQTFQDFEIIVVDDGMKVRAKDAALGFSDPRIRYIENETSLGGGGTRNRGIDEAKGEYIAFLDDDDEWLPEKLKKQVKALEKAPLKTGFVMPSVLIRKGNREEINYIEGGERDFSKITLRRLKGFLTSGLMVRREVLKEVGAFDTAFPSHQEIDLLVRISQKYLGIGIHEPLVINYFGTEGGHIGGDLRRRISGREMFLSKHSNLIGKDKDLLSTHLYWLGLMYLQSGDVNRAQKQFLSSLRVRLTFRSIVGFFRTFVQ